MAKISNAKPKNSSGGYLRLVENITLADIFTKAQSTVITNGSELEKILLSKAEQNNQNIKDLNTFLDDFNNDLIQTNCYICSKKILKKSKLNLKGTEPDFLIFNVKQHQRNNECYVIELKDGDSFDTKKSTSEKHSLSQFVIHLAPQIPFKIKFFICCFNQNSKEQIVNGFKSKFTIDEVMTGKEFCNLLNINYDEIVNQRQSDAKENFDYVLSQLSNIPEMIHKVNLLQQKIISKADFYPEESNYE